MDSVFSRTNVVSAAAISLLALLGTRFFNRRSKSHQENKTMASSSISLLDPLSSLTRNWKHHVFPSFHGEDVRKSFLSHIVKEFKSKGINLFIDNDLERSKSIGSELIEAIKGSRIAIVLLSENYASSTWCLNELVEIIKCRKVFDQTVISLFYQVDPTHVRKQIGDFGKVFKKTCVGKTKEEIRRWKHALTEVAQIAGYHSSSTEWKTEAEMIEAIATDVSNKLNLSSPSNDFDSLVGMESQMTKMRLLLPLNSDEPVRKIGILGPPGIGKTTLARYIFDQYSRDFQTSVFMDNIKRKHARPAYSDEHSVKLYLQEQLMSQLTNDKNIKVPHLGVAKDRLKGKKVLVVLDDVDQSVQVEAMTNETWVGPGSWIIITTQDQKVLKESGIDLIHRVNLPSLDEAHQMFCTYAFDQKHPKYGSMMLAFEVVSLVGKLPLALRVMGSYFRGMSKQDWAEALPRLRTHLDREGKIAGVLKFSYDALCDEDKRLFLHIACFFNGEPVDIMEACLEKFENVRQGLHVLDEKSLISIENGRIKMAKWLVQLGRKIVRDESVSEAGKRQFLNDAKNIGEVLGDDKTGSSNVIGIYLEWADEIRYTSETAFERLSNLEYLRISGYCGINPKSMNYISRKLRVLSWRSFPLPCFPSSFNPKFLVKLKMPRSHLKKLWEENKPLGNLKWMDLSYARRLKELPNLSTATNLQELNLHNCTKLVKLPSSIRNAINLRRLDLRSCVRLVEFSFGNAINLKKLNLSYCASLVKLDFPIGSTINLEELNLSYCASLVKLPSSIENAINLQKLDLSYCSSLVKLPSSIGNATNLQNLNLFSCSSLVKLPSSIGNATNLKRLSLDSCSSLVELPSSIGNIVNLERLHLSHCSSLLELPSSMRNLRRLSCLKLGGCSKLEVVLANINLESLPSLDLWGCSLLKSYHESSTDIEELDPWIGRISRLRVLRLCGMKKLVSLPPIPDSVVELYADYCESLERLDCSFGNLCRRLSFLHCFKLNQQARDLIIQTRTAEYAVFPTREVPQCFTYRSFGSSITVNLNQMPLGTSTKFKVCILCADVDSREVTDVELVYWSFTSRGNALTTGCQSVRRVVTGHLCTFEVDVETEKVTSNELVFEFHVGHWDIRREFFITWEIKECGILQLMKVRDGDEDCEPSDTESFKDDAAEYYEPSDSERFRDEDDDYQIQRSLYGNEDYESSDAESYEDDDESTSLQTLIDPAMVIIIKNLNRAKGWIY